MAEQYNLNNPSVKRIMREIKEMEKETSSQFKALPLEDNLFEWHFTIRGPQDTEFQGGIYHGRISLPPEYPFKPPNIILLTPNGRFEVGKKICLSISAHHPEYWQPSWSIRTVLVALISFMPTKGDGAIGALDYKPEERKILAQKSKSYRCETCGSDNATSLPPEEEIKPPSSIPPESGKEEVEIKQQPPKVDVPEPNKLQKPVETIPEPQQPQNLPPNQPTPPPSISHPPPPVNIPANRIQQVAPVIHTQQPVPVNNQKEGTPLDYFMKAVLLLIFAILVKKYLS